MSKDIPVVAQVIPTAEPKLVQVVAPATLNAGYSFLANVSGQTVSITVPEGGVKEGQTFTVPVVLASAPPTAIAGEATPLTGSAVNATDSTIPRGVWRDNLCDCCILGPCHPSFWNALCCPQILMAQVLTRMNMSWLAVRDSPDAKNTFKKVLALLVVYWIACTLLSPPAAEVVVEGDDHNPEVEVFPPDVNPLQNLLYQLVSWGFFLYTIVVVTKLRRAIRDRYTIPNTTCCPNDVEDCCCATFCGCCTVSQLARHTADYHERRALCCSTTGLPPSSTALHTVVVV